MQQTNIANPNIGGQFEAEMLENVRPPDTLDNAAALVTADEKKPRAPIKYRAKPKFPLPVPAKVFLLDLDGTLLDTANDIATAANRMREAFGFGPLEPAVIRNFIGRGIDNLVTLTMKNAVGELGGNSRKVAVAQFEKHYADCLADSSHAYPGVLEGLEIFKEKGFKLACVTNKSTRFVEPLLAKTGLLPYFELVIAGDTLAEKKPHPLPLQHAAKHFGVKMDEVVMVGDSMHDAAAARAAGCPVFIVPYGYNEGQELRGLDCDAFIDDLPSALKYAKIVF